MTNPRENTSKFSKIFNIWNLVGIILFMCLVYIICIFATGFNLSKITFKLYSLSLVTWSVGFYLMRKVDQNYDKFLKSHIAKKRLLESKKHRKYKNRNAYLRVPFYTK